MNIKIVDNPNDATGLTVVIDVFRAFTLEPYLFFNGAEQLIAVGDKNIAYQLKEKFSEYILIGERDGIKLPNFNYGNSPSQIENIDFSGKTIVHTTSCGTQGIVKSINASEIITGSLVNAMAVAKYIKKKNINDISLLALSLPNGKQFEEDVLCAEYIKGLLENKPTKDIDKKIEKLKNTTGAKFFDENKQDNFPKRDFYLCTQLNKFDFVLKVKKDKYCFMEKINI